MYYRNPQRKPYITIDARSEEEAEQCPFPSDILLDLPLPPLQPELLAEVTHQLYDIVATLDSDQCIKVFCAKGKRSAVVAAILKQSGFSNVIDLGGVDCR